MTIGPKAMAVLVCLARRPRRVVPKNDLLDAAWKDENVGDGSLFNAIREIRSALKRTAGSRVYDPEMVKTIRGEGYLLNAEVEWQKPMAEPASAAVPASPPRERAPPAAGSPPSRSRRPLTLIAVVALAVIVVAAWQFGSGGGGGGNALGWQSCHDETRISFEEAEKLYRGMQYDLAIDLLGRMIDADPSCAFPYELRARIYNNRGRQKLALRAIERALDRAESLGEIHRTFFLRRKAQIEGDIPKELEYLKQLNTLEPLNAEWHYHLGWFYKTHFKDCDKSRRRFQDAVKYDPRPLYHALLCDALLACGRVEEALSHLEEYAALEPGVTAHDYQGWVFTLIGRYERAEQLLHQARDLAPDYHHAVLSLGLYHFNRGHYSRAIDVLNDYRSRVELPNEEAVAYASLAEVYLARQDLDDALAQADRALSIKPDSRQALWVRGQALLARGDLSAAEEVTGKLEEIKTRSGSLYGMEYLHHLKGRLASAEGRLADAISEFREALALNPIDRAFIGNELASALFASGDLEGAEEAYLEILEFNPNYGRSRCGLGELYERQGFTDDAVDEYEHCLRAFGEDNSEEPLVARAKERLAVLR